MLCAPAKILIIALGFLTIITSCPAMEQLTTSLKNLALKQAPEPLQSNLVTITPLTRDTMLGYMVACGYLTATPELDLEVLDGTYWFMQSGNAQTFVIQTKQDASIQGYVTIDAQRCIHPLVPKDFLLTQAFGQALILVLCHAFLGQNHETCDLLLNITEDNVETPESLCRIHLPFGLKEVPDKCRMSILFDPLEPCGPTKLYRIGKLRCTFDKTPRLHLTYYFTINKADFMRNLRPVETY